MLLLSQKMIIIISAIRQSASFLLLDPLKVIGRHSLSVYNEHMTYTIENENYKAEISGTGAELQSLFVRGSGLECMWQGDPSVWAQRAPLLFPIVGRLRDDRYILDGREYTMTIHGFAKSLEFELLEHREDRLRLCLKSSDETFKKYPFDFTLISDYCLSEKGLSVTRIVENHSPRLMPFSIGEHFGFRLPFFPGEKLRDYRLEFPEKETFVRYPLTVQHLLGKPEPYLENTREIPIREDLFDRGALVFMGLKSRETTLGRTGARTSLTVRFDDYSVIAFWSKAGAGIPYICVEPWNGYDTPEDAGDDLYQKPGILMLEPGKSRSFTCQIMP